MTTFTTIADAIITQNKAILQSTGRALRDNVAATAEGSTDAPIVAAGWHPYDMVTVGDGADGEFYDFATDGSTVPQSTPDFEDGYEYMILMEDMTFNLGGTIRIDMYKETDAAYETAVFTSAAFASGKTIRGAFHVVLPRVAKYKHYIKNVEACISNAGDDYNDIDGSFFDGNKQKILRVRCTAVTATSRTGGKMYLYRRREYISG